jgi:pyruvate-ferredoxin/flavodoxin oxidoreductase
MTGGDGTAPGNSVKTAVHLLTATIESVKKPQFQSHIEYLSRLIEQLEQKIQGKVADTLNINDFESFSRRISRLEEKDVSIEQLSDVIDNDGSGRTINQVQLQRLTNLLEQLKKQHQLYEEGAGGTGRARMLLSIDPAVSWSSAYPYNSQLQPWVSHLPGDAALLAEALLEGVMHGLAEEVKSCRLAELELNDAYNSEQHDTMFRAFSWRDFNQQERQLIPVMLVICEPGTSVWAHISRLLTTTYPIMIAMINNEGISIAPTGDGPSDEQLRPTHSGLGKQSDLLNLGLAHTTIIQTTVGHPINLVKGAVDALENDAPSLLHIYAPNASSSGSAMEKIIGHAALAGQSRAFPLFRITAQSSSTTLSIDANPDFEHDWSTSELEFSEPSGLKSSLAVPLTLAHWALGESRFRQHFTLLAKGHLNEQMKPLVEYIDLDPAQREDLHPYIDFSDENQRHMLAQVSEAMVEATQESRKFWRHLCELAGNASDIELELPIPTAEKPNQQENIVNIDSSAYQRVTDKLLQLCGFSQDPDFFKQSLREFITETEQDNEEE